MFTEKSSVIFIKK